MEKTRLFLCDDHSLFRQGLKELLASVGDFEVVGEADNGEEAVDKIRELKPEVVLMDINMPGADGIQTTKILKKEFPDMKVVILTVSEEEENLFDAIKGGAQGYLLKNLRFETLVECIRGAAKGEAPISPALAGKILSEFAGVGRKAVVERSIDSEALSGREKEVLRLVSHGSSNREIAGELSISEHTVKKHLKNILEKLHLHNRVQAAAFALRKGMWRHDGEDGRPGH